MKFRLFGSLSIVLGAVLSGCAPAATNTEVPNALVAHPRIVSLTPSTQATSDLSLNCGCNFKLTILSFTGDTTKIKYSTTDPIDSSMSPHRVIFFAAPGAPSGTYAATMAFFAPDDFSSGFTDTVRATLVVP